MNVDLTWNDKMRFTAAAAGHEVVVDARSPIGAGAGMAPKELLLAAVASCTSMDVAALLRKHKQIPTKLIVHADGTLSQGGHPTVFTGIHLVFEIEGTVDPSMALESVLASQTRFCGVSAMLSKAVPITYEVRVNGSVAGTGRADFERALAAS
jgi:putative redox protein